MNIREFSSIVENINATINIYPRKKINYILNITFSLICFDVLAQKFVLNFLFKISIQIQALCKVIIIDIIVLSLKIMFTFVYHLCKLMMWHMPLYFHHSLCRHVLRHEDFSWRFLYLHVKQAKICC